jgi:PAS domain S-box-containing protein
MPATNPRSGALQIAAAYFLVAGAWIVFSDTIAVRLFPSGSELARVSQYKGLAFVLVTTVLLFLAMQRRLDAMDRMRRAAEASERRFAAFMENLPLAAFIRDREGRYLYVNRYWVEHLSGGREWRRRRPEDLFGRDTVSLANEDHARVLAGEPVTERILRLPSGGQEREFLVRRFPVHSGEELLVGAVAVDITEQRKLEEQLRQAAKMEAIGHLAGGIAHDFNNLLTVISGYAALLQRSGSDDTIIARGAAEISKASERAALLTAQLLVFSRKQVVQPAPLDLNASINALFSVVDRLVGENVSIERDCDPGLPQIMADRGQIDQVLLNLVLNARDAMPQGGVIRIKTRLLALTPAEAMRLSIEPAKYVQLSVKDDGVGMDERTRSRLFEPFFTTKAPGKGTGLGLSTVYGIVKGMRGAIVVESEPAEGAQFRLYIPAIESHADRPAEPPPVPRGQERILLVEDDRAVRGLARAMLESLGHQVVEAASGEEALRLFSSGDAGFQLVITDVAMPRMDGPELLRRLRATHPGVKALFLTGYSGELITDSDNVPVLGKPFTEQALGQAVRRALE